MSDNTNYMDEVAPQSDLVTVTESASMQIFNEVRDTLEQLSVKRS